MKQYLPSAKQLAKATSKTFIHKVFRNPEKTIIRKNQQVGHKVVFVRSRIPHDCSIPRNK